VDQQIRQRFEGWIVKAANGNLDSWRLTPRGQLALIVLTDQFPRNIYRNSAQAFAYDSLARAWCKNGLADGSHETLRAIERVFFYLPLEHSESLADQDRAIDLYRALLDCVPPQHKPKFEGFLDFAIRHREIIRRFGRFPHRNRMLGRESTAAELIFLSQPSSSF
jgi:uncharacterized protein (DUF924 family)